uniref:40S ribosomal protein S27 n=1 Tax=Equus caballus TaxID=9796 RepID=F6PMX5_HORSE
ASTPRGRAAPAESGWAARSAQPFARGGLVRTCPGSAAWRPCLGVGRGGSGPPRAAVSGVRGWEWTAARLARDLLHPSLEEEKKKHKKKRLVQSPNSYFMDVKCPGCYKITTVFSHAQTVVLCVGCSTVLCQPTGGKARLTEGCSFRRKQH